MARKRLNYDSHFSVLNTLIRERNDLFDTFETNKADLQTRLDAEIGRLAETGVPVSAICRQLDTTSRNSVYDAIRRANATTPEQSKKSNHITARLTEVTEPSRSLNPTVPVYTVYDPRYSTALHLARYDADGYSVWVPAHTLLDNYERTDYKKSPRLEKIAQNPPAKFFPVDKNATLKGYQKIVIDPTESN